MIMFMEKNLKPMSLDKDLVLWTVRISGQLWNEIRISQMLPLLDKEASLVKRPGLLKPWTCLLTCRVTTSAISSILVLCQLDSVVAMQSSAVVSLPRKGAWETGDRHVVMSRSGPPKGILSMALPQRRVIPTRNIHAFLYN
jgi:hypothetical protein